MKIKLLASMGVLLLTGCTVGQSDFNCSSGDENALCASSRTLYKASNGDIKENEKITYIKDGEVHQTTLSEINGLKDKLENESNDSKDKSNDKKGGEETKTTKNVQLEQMQVPLQFSYDGDVLRKDVRVLRIWVAPWVDKSDDLHLSTLIYTDIEKRKWEIGTQYQKSNVGATPHLSSNSVKSDSKTVTQKQSYSKKYRPRNTATPKNTIQVQVPENQPIINNNAK